LKRELMARQIIAVVVGYVAMFVLISVAFTAEYLLLGARHAFKPGSLEASNDGSELDWGSTWSSPLPADLSAPRSLRARKL